MRKEITEILIKLGLNYMEKGEISSFEIVNLHDVHAFYKLKKTPEIIINVQGYPGMSDSNIMRVNARLRDYEIMLIERTKGKVSVGNEHKANIPCSFRTLDTMQEVPYDAKELEELLSKDSNFSYYNYLDCKLGLKTKV